MQEKYIGIGIQRKGRALPNQVVGWFEYGFAKGQMQLAFKGRDCPSMEAAIACLHKIMQDKPFVAFYSQRGTSYYLRDAYVNKHGEPRESQGRLMPYDEDEAEEVSEGMVYTRLAADVMRLRRCELEWPASQFVSVWKNLRQQIRESELDSEPGRGQMIRLLVQTQKEMQTEWVAVAAMALAAVRRCWSEYQEGGGEHSLLAGFEMAVGTWYDPRREQAMLPTGSLPDPLWAFTKQEHEFIDYEASASWGGPT